MDGRWDCPTARPPKNLDLGVQFTYNPIGTEESVYAIANTDCEIISSQAPTSEPISKAAICGCEKGLE